MAHRTAGKPVHVIRLGTAAAPRGQYLRGHDDAVSWTSDVALAVAFLDAGEAKRFAARRLGGAWHVAEIDRTPFSRLVLVDEIDDAPERDAGVDRAPELLAPTATILTRQQGEALMSHRRAIRACASTPFGA